MKTISKRVLSLLLALAMVLSMIPAVSAEGTVLAKGDKILNNCFEVLANPTSNGWTISGEGSETVLSDTSASGSGQRMLQLKNLMEERTLSFDWQTSGNATFSVKIGSGEYDPNAATGSGSFEDRIPAGATVYLREQKAGTVTISNIKFDPDEAAVNVTFEPAENGSYTVDGQPITESTAIPKTTLDSYALAATPEEGYEFVGWYDLTNGASLSTQAEYNLSVLSDVSVTALFSKIAGAEGPFSVGDSYFDNFADAKTYAVGHGADTVVLAQDYTLTEDITVPAGITLLIPYNDANDCFTNNFTVNGQHPSVSNSYATPTPYRTLTVAGGATLTVNGKLSVSGQHFPSSNYSKNYGPSGPLGYVYLMNGAEIVVNGGLYAYGYVYGPGSVTINSGAEVYEIMQIAGFRGGGATLAMSQDSRRVFPLSQYYVQNVESAMTLKAGAVEYVATSLKPGGENALTASVPFIHPNSGMFRMSEGELVKTYDGSKDRLDLDVNGTGSINSLVVDVPGVTSVDSANFVLPITNNISINVNGGTIALGQDIAFLPGTQVNVASGAAVEVEAGNKVYVYDRDEWVKDGDYFCYEYQNKQVRMNPILYAPGQTYTRTEADLVDARIVVDGTLIVKGEAYTTESGAEIVTNNHKGYVIFEADAGTETVTYQYDQGDLIKYVSIAIDPVRLYNGGGSKVVKASGGSYTETADAVAGNTYGWSEAKQMWVKGLLLSFDPNGGQGSMEPQFMELVDEMTAEEDTIQPNTFTKTGWKFAGWALNPDEEEAMYLDEDQFSGNDDGNFINTTLYAVWEPLSAYDVTWFDGDGKELAVTQVVEGEHPVYEGDEPTKTSTVESDFEFAGWTSDGGTTVYGINEELPAVTGPITYTAVFNPVPRTYRVSYNANGGTGSMAPQFVAYGSEQTLAPNTFEYFGYEFTGWNTEANGSGTSYADKATFTVSGDLTLYAQWGPKMVTVRFLNDDAEHTVLYTTQVQQGTSPSFVGEDPTKESDAYYDYTFAGWKLGETRYSKTSLLPPVDGDTDFVAYYTAAKRTYSVMFDPNSGYFQGNFSQFGNSMTPLIEYEAGTMITMPTVMRNGYTFLGWSDGSGELIPAGEPYELLGSKIFLAVWQVTQYTVTFMPGEGGEGSMDPMTFTFGETKTLTPNAFTRTGHEFGGWKDQAGNTFTDGQSVTYDFTYNLTLTAQWIELEYTVTFDPNGGSETGMEEFDAPYGTEIELPTSERTGYSLMWKDLETNVEYAPGTTYTVTKNVNFQAVWTLIQCTVTWVIDGVEETETYDYGATPAYKGGTPTKEGDAQYSYTFNGWDPEITSDTIVTEDVTYTAQFTQNVNRYTVTVETDGNGTAEASETEADYGTSITVTAATTFAGYVFDKWTNADGETVSTDASYTFTLTEDVTLKANFKLDIDPVAKIGNNYFETLDAAVAVANFGDTIVLLKTWTQDHDVTIPAGVTLLLPYAAGQETINGADAQHPYANEAITTGSYKIVGIDQNAAYTLTLDNAVMELGSGAKLVVGGTLGGYQPIGGGTTGSHSVIRMTGDNAAINVPDGAILSNTGFITGGKVNVTGGKVYEPLVVTDYHGGTVTTNRIAAGSSPFNSYAMMNIQSELILDSGAEMDCYAMIYAGSQQNLATVKAVGTGSDTLFKTTDTTKVTLTYDPENTQTVAGVQIGKTTFAIEGDLSFMTMKLVYSYGNGGQTTLDTANVVMAIPYSFDVIQKSGTFTVGSDAVILPGCTVTVMADAKAEIKTGHKLFVANKFDPNNEGGMITYPADLTDERGNLFIDGELTIPDDATFGGVAQTNGTGKIVVGASAILEDSFTSGGDTAKKEYELTGRVAMLGEDGNKLYEMSDLLGDEVTYYAVSNAEVPVEGLTPVTGTWGIDVEITLFANYDGADPATQDVDARVGVATTLPENPFTREGYTFAGWTTDPDGGETVTTYTPTIDSDCTVYAQWTVNSYTVSFTVDGEPYGEPITVEFGKAIQLPDAPTKEGYTFSGWKDVPETMPAHNVTITGTFTIKTFTVTWIVDGVETTEEYEYGATPEYKGETPAKATAENEDGTYTFIGWDPAITSDTTVTADATYTAQFTFTGWRSDENGKKYYIDDEEQTGWLELEGKKYYLDPTNDNYAAVGIAFIGEGDHGHAFDSDGVWMEGCTEQVFTDVKTSDIYLVENGLVEVYPGLWQDPETKFFYYFGGDEGAEADTAIRGTDAWVAKNHADPNDPGDRGLLPKWGYDFDENGVIAHDDVNLNGIVETEPGVYYYYIDGVKAAYGMFEKDGNYYYATSSGKLVTSRTYWCTNNYDTGFAEGPYTFDEYGRMIIAEEKNGIYEEEGSLFYYENGTRTYAGLTYLEAPVKYHAANGSVTDVEAGYYYVKGTGEVVHGRSYWITKNNGNENFPQGAYTFKDNGCMVIPDAPVVKYGIYEENDSLFYYVDNVKTYAGLIHLDSSFKYHAADGTVTDVEEGYYYVKGSGEVVHGRSYWITKTNGIEGFPEGAYEFGEKGKMVIPEVPEVKNGIYEENDSLFFYVNGKVNYAGLIYLDGTTKYHAADGTVTDVVPGYYYAKGTGEMIHGRSYWITKTNGIEGFKQGAYTFDEHGRIVQ